jgi:enamine deaminase RidA (YjgF/YER057c/UK114 family)
LARLGGGRRICDTAGSDRARAFDRPGGESSLPNNQRQGAQMQTLHPSGWSDPIGYANGIAAPLGRIVFVAGQVGWDHEQSFHSAELVPQFEQALKNAVAVVAAAGGKPENICRITAYCTDKAAYLAARPALGQVWRGIMGRHYPAMSLVFVSALVDEGAKIEIEATAVIAD